jgi:hypothetical protein
MSKQVENMKPFLSIMIFIVALLAIVFCKMEVRRVGYMFWKATKQEKEIKDDLRVKSLEFAKLTRPDRVEKYARQFWALNKPESGQVVQLQTTKSN